jgi:hypothetical protein
VPDQNSDGVSSVQSDRTRLVRRRDKVLRFLAATRSARANKRKRHQLFTKGLRKELRSHRETIRTVQMMIRRSWNAPDDEEGLIDTARQKETVRAGDELLDALNGWQQFSEQLGDDCLLPEEKTILQAIQRHPEGVSIVEIGNELGVDFRRLLVSTDMLLASGQIDQVQELFYPAGR